MSQVETALDYPLSPKSLLSAVLHSGFFSHLPAHAVCESGSSHLPASLQLTPPEEITVSQCPKYPGLGHLHLCALPWSPTTSPLLLFVLWVLWDTSLHSLYDCGF